MAVVVKRTSYRQFVVEEHDPLVARLLRRHDPTVVRLKHAHEAHEATVREAAFRLSKYGLARLASGHSSRATKYRHLAEEGLGLERAPLAVLCVLGLTGRQVRATVSWMAVTVAFAALAAGVPAGIACGS